MKTVYDFIVCITFLMLSFCSEAWANNAMCTIEIEDVNQGSTYTLEHKFQFEKGGVAQRKVFEVPGNDYVCTLAFFDLNTGTMISCEYKNDIGHTFFQSDRSILHDEIPANNLTFRHKSAFIVVKSKCE